MILLIKTKKKIMKKSITKTTLAIICMMFSVTIFAQQSAKLIAYRKGSPYGLFAKFPVNVDGKEVGKLKSGSVVTTDLTVGSHSISPKQSKRAITLNAQAGKTYVVKYRNMLSLFGVRPRLKEVTLEEAKADYRKVM